MADVFYILSLLVLYLFWHINPELMFLATSFYALCYLALVLEFDIKKPIAIGLIISFSYLTFYKDIYNYNSFSLAFFQYPMFPLIAWPVGLTILSYYVIMLLETMEIEKTWVKITIAYSVYITMMVFVEYTAYHYVNIRLLSNYPSLPLIDCLHTPADLKVVYFVNGLIFFSTFLYMADEKRASTGLGDPF
jgi:hypothetical protein